MRIRENVITVGCDLCGEDTKTILEIEEEFNHVPICNDCLEKLSKLILKELDNKTK